jgi:hypothetical protein
MSDISLAGRGYGLPDKWIKFITPDTTKPIYYLEIGVLCAHSLITCERIYGAHPDSRLYGVDPWDLVNVEYTETEQIENAERYYNACVTNIQSSKNPNKFKIFKEFSHIQVPKFPDEFFDIVYIDGNHNTHNVLEDAILSFRKLKSGGYLVFDDCLWATVEKGIHHFCEAMGNKIVWIGLHEDVNYFRKSSS